jgi:hypothetical protein
VYLQQYQGETNEGSLHGGLDSGVGVTKEANIVKDCNRKREDSGTPIGSMEFCMIFPSKF